MAQKRIVTLECDRCGADRDVAQHTVSIDKKAPILVDACDPCWGSAHGPMADLLEAGRSERRVAARRRRASVA